MPTKMLAAAAAAAVVWVSELETRSSIARVFVDCLERAMVTLLLSLFGSLWPLLSA